MVELYRITRVARRDLDSIYFYTAETWSLEQADRYDRQMHTAFDHLVEQPDSGKLAEKLEGEIRLWLAGNHGVFYTSEGDEVVVLRVHHQSSDWQSLLAENFA